MISNAIGRPTKTFTLILSVTALSETVQTVPVMPCPFRF
jgi:hypothetical protein